jgi:predicted 3-demethylubiquinone-9 3-methyltransferase (glyoxalase superfamily)
MQKIVPNLWFNHTAAEAAAFYAATFPNARVTDTQYYPTEGLLDFQAEFAGAEIMVSFEIEGYSFIAINAGPEFTVNPSISFMLNFDPSVDPDAREHLDQLWEALSDGGKVMMPLGEYPHSPHYGWTQDRYGISWQLILTHPGGDPRPFIVPTLLFCGAAQNRALDAAAFYTATFPGARIGTDVRYSEQVGPAVAGSAMFTDVELFGQWFGLMDASREQDYTFNCGVSLMISCDGQAELDGYWTALSAVPEAEQCGWCADQFGVSWQVVPANLGELMVGPDSYAKLMAMKKIEIAAFG